MRAEAAVAVWPFHEHKWVEYTRTYSPPQPDEAYRFASAYHPERVERLIHGFTTVTYDCDCGALKTVVMLGKAP